MAMKKEGGSLIGSGLSKNRGGGSVAVHTPTTPTNTGEVTDLLADLFREVGGNTGGDGGASASAAAATAAAQKAGKDQSAKENAATSNIVDALFRSLDGFTAGRDQQLANNQSTFTQALAALSRNYDLAATDAEAYAARNEQDYDSKTMANVTNMVRESGDVLAQVLSQGAGETDALRALSQATRMYDANQLEVAGAANDTRRSILGQLASAGSAAENARVNAYGQQQEGRISIMEAFNKNMQDTWTNIQRTEAGNTNVDSDYSTAYQPKYTQAGDEVTKYIGKTPAKETMPEGWAATWDGKRTDDSIAPVGRTGNRAAAVSAGPLKKAEGAVGRLW